MAWSGPTFRVMLALVVAVWAPLWCCCHAQASEGKTTARSAAAVHDCCGAKGQDEGAGKSGSHDSSPGAPGKACPCERRVAGQDRVTAVEATSVHLLPGLQAWAVMSLAPAMVDVDGLGVNDAGRWIGFGTGASADRSLVGQFCLLRN
ncbi:MAG: hypothetical protein IT442_15240 [Phycisphaeraceae bacterium]|nr:hypothetical protein [Phycisphaeraceae bacterium]